jgi:glycosyltransferase involved in cell wall biosynthesis
MIRSGARDVDFTSLKRLGMASATLVVANSRAGLNAWAIKESKGRLVYNGFDRTRLEAVKAGSKGRDSAFTVVMTGRMVPVKNYDLMLAAARLLSTDSKGWRFLLVGDGPDRSRLVRDASDLVKTGTVAFPEPGTEALTYVGEADVGVLMTNPSLREEGLSNSIMEYMAAGLPVVCGRGGGNAELVVDGVNGFIIPPTDASALAEHLAYLRAHPQLRQAMGEAGRTRVMHDFSVQKMVRNTLRVYAEALAVYQRACPRVGA